MRGGGGGDGTHNWNWDTTDFLYNSRKSSYSPRRGLESDDPLILLGPF